jgi:tRNA dimethylallyltransferase
MSLTSNAKSIPPPILALVGPTASGKTAVALSLAKSLRCEIISADSRQVYRHLDIGTAKPTPAELESVPHHFINLIEPTEEYSAGQFGRDARRTIDDIRARSRIPFLVGGSGLYLKAVIDGLADVPEAKEEIRSELEKEYKRFGLGHLVDELRSVDEKSLLAMKEINARRVLRALEVYRMTGIPLSHLQEKQKGTPSLDVLQVGLRWNRTQLYRRIDERVDAMVKNGLIEECMQLVAQGFDRRLNALNTVGYKEVFEFLDSRLSREAMIETIKRNSRRFAKRQMTWFRADKRIHWIDVDESMNVSDLAAKVEEFIQEHRVR